MLTGFIVLALVAALLVAYWPRAVPQKRRAPFQPRGHARPPSDRLRAIAAQRRQELLERATVPEIRFNEILRGMGFVEGVDYERERIWFYPGSFCLIDFYFLQALLLCELDGSSHNAPGQREHDAGRDAYFASQGLRTCRIPNTAVMRHPAACRAIVVRATGRAAPRRHFFGPPTLVWHR
jgi:very-short-patch-repair endonuclease